MSLFRGKGKDADVVAISGPDKLETFDRVMRRGNIKVELREELAELCLSQTPPDNILAEKEDYRNFLCIKERRLKDMIKNAPDPNGIEEIDSFIRTTEKVLAVLEDEIWKVNQFCFWLSEYDKAFHRAKGEENDSIS